MNRCLYPRGAFSLLEVVLALMLLATLLTTIVMAIGQQRQQLWLAANRRDAALVADQLLMQWQDSTTGIPYQSLGAIPGRANWYWRTRVLSNERAFGLSFPKIGLQIGKSQENREIVLLYLEVLAPPRIQEIR